MRSLILFLLISSPAFAKKCREYEKVAEYLDTQKFIKASKLRQDEVDKIKKADPKSKISNELDLDVGDINQARYLAYRLPAFEDLGFGKPGNTGWEPYKSRMGVSALHGKDIGWQIKNDNGFARVRLDWDETKGGHYNIEIFKGKETHKLAVKFNCGDKKCTEDQVNKIAERMQKNN